MRFSLTKSLIVLAVLSGVDARPAHEPAVGSLNLRAVKDGQEVNVPKPEVSVTVIKAPESTVQMFVFL